MALVGQTAAQYQQAQQQMMIQTSANIASMIQNYQRLQFDKQKSMMDSIVTPLIKAYGNDPVAAAKANPEIFARVLSYEMNPKQAQAAALELGKGNMSVLGNDSYVKAIVASGSAGYSESLSPYKAEAEQLGSIDNLISYRDSLQQDSPEYLEASTLISNWSPEEKTFRSGTWKEPSMEEMESFKKGKIRGFGLWDRIGDALGFGKDEQTPQAPQAPTVPMPAPQATPQTGAYGQVPLPRTGYGQMPVMAQGGSPANQAAQMQMYEQATGDIHRPALVGDQEYIMNREAVKQFGPILEMMNNIASNPLGGMAPKSMGGMPVRQDGGMGAAGAQAPGMWTPPQQGGQFNIPGVTPQQNQGGINPNTPPEQLLQMVLADPNKMAQLSPQQLQILNAFTEQQNAQLETQATEEYKQERREQFGVLQVDPATGKAVPTTQLPADVIYISPDELAANRDKYELAADVASQYEFYGQRSGNIPVRMKAAPAAPATSAEEKSAVAPLEPPSEKAQVASESVRNNQPVNGQQRDILARESRKAGRWFATQDTPNAVVDQRQVENYLNRFYPEGMTALDLLSTPAQAASIRLEEKRLEESIRQFNEDLDFRKESLDRNLEFKAMAEMMDANTTAYKQVHKDRWDQAQTIDDRFWSVMLNIASTNKTTPDDPKVQKAFNDWLAKDPNRMVELNWALQVLGESTQNPYVQQYEVLPDIDKVGFWFKLRRFFSLDKWKEEQNINPATGMPMTTGLGTYDMGSGKNITVPPDASSDAATRSTDQQVDDIIADLNP